MFLDYRRASTFDNLRGLGVALFERYCVMASRCSCNPLASASGSETRFGVALVVENGVDGYSLINAACGMRATRARFCLRLRLSFGRRVALVGKSLNQRVASFACSVRRTSPPTACGSYTRATVGSGSFGLARKREPPVRLRTAAYRLRLLCGQRPTGAVHSASRGSANRPVATSRPPVRLRTDAQEMKNARRNFDAR